MAKIMRKHKSYPISRMARIVHESVTAYIKEQMKWLITDDGFPFRSIQLHLPESEHQHSSLK